MEGFTGNGISTVVLVVTTVTAGDRLISDVYCRVEIFNSRGDIMQDLQEETAQKLQGRRLISNMH